MTIDYKKILKKTLLVLTVFFGIFLFIFGELDDSPGAEFLGLIIFVLGIFGLLKNYKK